MNGTETIQKAIDFCEQNLNGEITVDELAARSGYSVYHFCRMFQHAVGCGPMEYLTLANARKRGKIQCDELPFVKRYGYKPEHEFRTIYGSKTEQISSLSIPIRISSIRSISLSPWMHPTLRDSTVKAIRENQGCEKLKISRSTLISNDEWKRLGAGGK